MSSVSSGSENKQSSLVAGMTPSETRSGISHTRLAIVIPTYKRVPLLQRLLEDISSQTIQPCAVIVVDGDPASGEVSQMLINTALPTAWRIVYLPSNHANAPYQRYLGWRVASEIGGDVLLYFDDDLRLRQPDALAKIIAPFTWDEPDIMGVTAEVQTGDVSRLPGTEALRDPRSSLWSAMARLFGSSARVPPGGLSPVGHRRLPVREEQSGYALVQWMWGRVMAYRMAIIDRDRFSRDAFAMAHIKCGLTGDDTVLSRDICYGGRILAAFETGIEHPHDDTPKAYSYQARGLAYAVAYTRRFINDVYRNPAPPTLSDRLALLKNYVGVTAFAWLRAVTSFKAYRFAYAWGYTQGAMRGLVQKPTAKNLTPHIDWWADAEKALKNLRIIQE